MIVLSLESVNFHHRQTLGLQTQEGEISQEHMLSPARRFEKSVELNRTDRVEKT